MIFIDYNFITVFEACYILKNFNGYLDADRKELVLNE